MKKLMIALIAISAASQAWAADQTPCSSGVEQGVYSGQTPQGMTCSLKVSCRINISAIGGTPIPLYDFELQSEALSKLDPDLTLEDSEVVSMADKDLTQGEGIAWENIEDGLVKHRSYNTIKFEGLAPTSFTTTTTRSGIFGRESSPRMNTDCRDLKKD